MVRVAKSLGLSLFIFIASNFADSFPFFLGEPHFKPLSRCDTVLELFFNKAITSFLTTLFLPSPQHMPLPPFPCLHKEIQSGFDGLALDMGKWSLGHHSLKSEAVWWPWQKFWIL